LARTKKKLTDDEKLLYRLCLELGDFPHPDYLLPWLTWEQVKGWRQYSREEPWGEERADDRAAANTMWTIGAGHTSDLPELRHPYFTSAEVLWEKHKELEGRQEQMNSSEHQAKLKAARQKHLEEKRRREGK
jgi:hypothetical protein